MLITNINLIITLETIFKNIRIKVSNIFAILKSRFYGILNTLFVVYCEIDSVHYLCC